SKIIGEVPAGQTKTTEFEINASKSVTRMENRFTVSATESYGFPPDPAQISFETFPFIPPKLALVDYGISTATGDNIIRPGVVVTVQARVQNTGQGEAEGSAFSINLPTGVYPSPDSRQNYTFSSLKPGEFKDLEFSFTPSKKVGKTINLAIGFTERSSSGKFPLKLDVKKPQQSIQQLVVKGQELGKVAIANVATVSVDIEKGIPKSSRKGKKDLAVVFGIERYKNVPGVSFAKRDALWTKKYFENVLGIPSNRIYYKTDSDVGQAEFSKVFSKDGWIDKRIKNNETNVFIYYAGHGAPDIKANKAYLIPYDGDPNYASQTGYEMDKLYAELGNMKAKSVTVFLDACFSGANRDNEMLLAGARPVFIEVKSGIPGNVTVFSAAGGKEISSAWPEKKHGLFSYYLMKGMRGDADANKDKKITVGELGDYIRENVSDMAGMLDREQTPGLQTVDRDKVLIRY
ncbi:MAG: caspase family protein, partial [Candidatus Marinimicrobia bacterium]|nr:caspase family protein [Candidatus Neomarinimicrobiota bacterium]